MISIFLSNGHTWGKRNKYSDRKIGNVLNPLPSRSYDLDGRGIKIIFFLLILVLLISKLAVLVVNPGFESHLSRLICLFELLLHEVGNCKSRELEVCLFAVVAWTYIPDIQGFSQSAC